MLEKVRFLFKIEMCFVQSHLCQVILNRQLGPALMISEYINDQKPEFKSIPEVITFMIEVIEYLKSHPGFRLSGGDFTQTNQDFMIPSPARFKKGKTYFHNGLIRKISKTLTKMVSHGRFATKASTEINKTDGCVQYILVVTFDNVHRNLRDINAYLLPDNGETVSYQW